MVKKYHNHTLQTDPRHREEETKNTYSHMTSGSIKAKQPALSLFNVKMIAKLEKDTKKCITKQRPAQNPHKQCEVHKNNESTTTEPPP